MAPTERDALVALWCSGDHAWAVHAADHELIDGSLSLRAMIVDLARSGGADEELYDACAMLGRFIAQRNGSPTLAAQTIDHAAHALGAQGARWLAPARGALAEGFASALLEKAHQDALKSWEFPRCVVTLDDGRMAIAAGYPSEDPELLSEWAAKVANAAALQGVRRAFVSGPDLARATVEDALAVAGIELDRRW